MLLLTNALILIYFNLQKAEGKETNLYFGLLTCAVCIGLVFLSSLIPFGQVVEKISNTNFVTFYQLGRLRFNLKTFENPTSVTITQDQNRYYCLTIKLPDGQNFVVEKYPTLDNAELRIEELKRVFS